MKKRKGPKKVTIEKVLHASVRYYETLYLVRDGKGERVYTGSEAVAKRVARSLAGQRWEGRTVLARAVAMAKARKRARSR